MHYLIGLILILLFNCSCLATNKKDKKDDSQMNELQLQEEIQRFYTRFTERIVESRIKDQTIMQNNTNDILRQYLLYDSEALKIATSPYPVVNLLDMMVFIKLNEMVIEDFWIPKVYGKSGQVVLEAFQESEKDIEQVASKLLTPSQIQDLENYVQDWRKNNPHQVRVEKIRFGDFSKYAKEYGVQEKKGFSLVDTQSAVKAVDQMVLVANRGIFLAQHMPLIIRLHSRLGVQEIIADTTGNFELESAQMMEDIQATQPLVNGLTELAQQSDVLVRDLRGLLSETKHKFPSMNMHQGLSQLTSLVDKTTLLLQQIKSGRPLAENDLGLLRSEFHNAIWFIAFVIIFVGIILALAWWGGYYVCKRLLQSSGNKTSFE